MIQLSRVTDDERFGITLNDNMMVARVDRRSIAYAAGVREGQQLLEVNGVPCYNCQVVTSMIRESATFRMWFYAPRESAKNTKRTWILDTVRDTLCRMRNHVRRVT